MTYTLFECLKEQITELLDELETELKNAIVQKVAENVKTLHIAPVIQTTETIVPKKEQMTKSQKRRLWDRSDNKGNRQRGWNWVDIIRHLSQTGQKEEVVLPAGQLAPPPNN